MSQPEQYKFLAKNPAVATIPVLTTTFPARFVHVLEPAYGSLARLIPGEHDLSPAHLIVGARRIGHALQSEEWFAEASKEPASVDQWEAERQFAMGVAALTAAVDNCCLAISEVFELGLKRPQCTISGKELRKALAAKDPQLAERLFSLGSKLRSVTAYRHAAAHHGLPLVVHNSDQNALSVTMRPDTDDVLRQLFDLVEGGVQKTAPPGFVLRDGIALVQSIYALTCRGLEAHLEQSKPLPRQPSPREAGRAFVDFGRSQNPASFEVLQKWAKGLVKLYPPDDDAQTS